MSPGLVGPTTGWSRTCASALPCGSDGEVPGAPGASVLRVLGTRPPATSRRRRKLVPAVPRAVWRIGGKTGTRGLAAPRNKLSINVTYRDETVLVAGGSWGPRIGPGLAVPNTATRLRRQGRAARTLGQFNTPSRVAVMVPQRQDSRAGLGQEPPPPSGRSRVTGDWATGSRPTGAWTRTPAHSRPGQGSRAAARTRPHERSNSRSARWRRVSCQWTGSLRRAGCP